MHTGQVRLSAVVLAGLLAVGVRASAGGQGSPVDATTDSAGAQPIVFRSQVLSESAIGPPTASFALVERQAFSFVLVEDSLAAGQISKIKKGVFTAGFGPYPVRQRIICLGRIEMNGLSNFALANQAKMINTRARISPTAAEYRRTSATANIDSLTGRILSEVRRDSVGQEVPDTLAGSYWGFSRTLWEFYGRWMLYLADDFSYELVEQNPAAGIIKTSLTTVGREKIGKRECFVVHYHRGAPGYQGINRTYWVDVQKRVALQVREEHMVFKLVAPREWITDDQLRSPPDGEQ